MRPILTLSAAALISAAVVPAALAQETTRTFTARMTVDGPSIRETSATSTVAEGEPVRLSGWDGPARRFERSPGYDMSLTPTLRDGTLDVVAQGRVNVAARSSRDDGPRVVRQDMLARTSLPMTDKGYVYEQGLPGGKTLTVTFVPN